MITAGDFLAGGGGVTEALKNISNVNVSWVLNHDPIAIRTNLFNHKGIKHYWADFYKQDEHEMDIVDFVWASIECTQHSRANGGREKKIGSYTLAWELLRYVQYLKPFVIGIENVPEFKDWAPLDEEGKPIKERKGEEFRRWRDKIISLGYEYSECICNAADFGIPTRRVRYFAFFYLSSLNMSINWPNPTHSKDEKDGLKKWVPCKSFIDLSNEGNSIFGREFNPNVRKGKRKPLSPNTLRRIAGGIKKFAPETNFVFQYYGNGLNVQSINSPLNSITTKDRHVLVKIEKKQFIQDHCHTDNYNLPDEPLNPILTRQTKQLITLEKKQFIADYYGRDNTAHSIDGPSNAITTQNSKHLVTIKSQFISEQYNSNGKPESNNKSITSPLGTITSNQKHQFITAYFKSSDKKALVSLDDEFLDFDIKMRFLEPEELSMISTFPKGYFTNPLLRLNKKEQTKLIGNAVPPKWAEIIIQPVIEELEKCLVTTNKKIA